MVVVDDTITDGAAKIEACELIDAAGGRVIGVLIAMDRRERVTGARTAVEHLEDRLGVPVRSVARLEDVVRVLRHDSTATGRLEAVSRVSRALLRDGLRVRCGRDARRAAAFRWHSHAGPEPAGQRICVPTPPSREESPATSRAAPDHQ